MYLSKLVLNPRAHQVRRDLTNPYQTHASLCWAFRKPEALSEAETGSWERGKTVYPFLWRLEPPQPRAAPILLVQSEVEPQWDVFAERHPNYFSRKVKVGKLPLEHLVQGQTLRFRLKANPTVTKRHDDQPDKQKRVGLYKMEDLLGYRSDNGEWILGWIERQSDFGTEQRGFVVGAQDVILRNTERLRFHKHEGGHPITLQSALFDGYLKITDVDLFKETLAKGVGKAKGLGFGLLSVARA